MINSIYKKTREHTHTHINIFLNRKNLLVKINVIKKKDYLIQFLTFTELLLLHPLFFHKIERRNTPCDFNTSSLLSLHTLF